MEGLLRDVEANLTEVRGQIEEGGNAKDAATDLLDSVQRLVERIEERGMKN